MAVNTYMFDFSISPSHFETSQGKQELQNTVERGLKQFLPDLKRVNSTLMDGGVLMLLAGGRGLFATVRGFRQGVLTVNIEYYKSEDEEKLLDFTVSFFRF